MSSTPNVVSSRQNLPAELRLLAAATAGPLVEDRRRAVESALADPGLDWDKVTLAVERHRMAGFVQRALLENGIRPPEGPANVLRNRALQDARSALMGAAEAVRLTRALQDAGVPVLAFKGPALAASVHGDIAVRQSKDIDLLVPPERFAQAMRLCQHAGYQIVPPCPDPDDPDLRLWIRRSKDVVMSSGSTGVLLELHCRPVGNRRLARRLDLWSGAVSIPLGDAKVALPAPSREALYAYLCIHGASHAWFRMKWLG